MNFSLRSAVTLLSLSFFGLMLNQQAAALTYDLPDNGTTIVGDARAAQTITGDTLSSLGRRYEVGIYEFKEANPWASFDKEYAPGKNVIVPTQFILPDAPHKGIVINLAELRLYFYVPNTRKVMTFPVGVGRDGWDTPLGETYIATKTKDPVWHVPASIKEARLGDGVSLPDHVDPGPDNPLGPYAMHLGFPGYLIHGSNDPTGIGRRSSSGCIRMQPEAIESFFNLVPMHMLVTVVDQPVKVGWLGNDLYVESHVPLTGNDAQSSTELDKTLHKLVDAETAKRHANIDWDMALKAVHDQHGYPVKIGEGTGPIPQMDVAMNPEPIVKVLGSNSKEKKDKKEKKVKSKTKHHDSWEGLL